MERANPICTCVIPPVMCLCTLLCECAPSQQTQESTPATAEAE